MEIFEMNSFGFNIFLMEIFETFNIFHNNPLWGPLYIVFLNAVNICK